MSRNYNQALYSGISFPPRKDGNAGFFAISTDLDVIKESIHVLLNTRKGEMPMNPDFGSSAIDLLFDIVTQNSQVVISQHIQEDIERWEPRITIDSISAYSNQNSRIIVINGIVNLTNEQFSFNYQFTA